MTPFVRMAWKIFGWSINVKSDINDVSMDWTRLGRSCLVKQISNCFFGYGRSVAGTVGTRFVVWFTFPRWRLTTCNFRKSLIYNEFTEYQISLGQLNEPAIKSLSFVLCLAKPSHSRGVGHFFKFGVILNPLKKIS